MFIFGGSASAAVQPPDDTNTTVSYAVTKDADNKDILMLYRNSANGSNASSLAYSVFGFADEVNKNTSLNDNSTVGEASFDPSSKTATLVKSRVQSTLGGTDYYHQVAGYIAFNASITVPAYTEYTIDFSYIMTLTRTASAGTKTTATVGAELLYYGSTADTTPASDASSTMTFRVNAASSSTYSYGAKYFGNKEGTEVYNSGSDGVNPVTVTMANQTGQAQTFTAYFGFYSYSQSGSSSMGSVWYTNTLQMSESVSVTSIKAPTVNVSEAEYKIDGNTFNFSNYDENRLDYTVQYTDLSDRVSDKTSTCTINTDGSCTLTDAGTYVFTFSIKNNCGAVWDSETNDQSDKTVTVTIKQKVLSAPSGTVETEYNGDRQSLSTLSSPPRWYDSDIYGNSSVIAINDVFTDAGEYEVTVTLISGGFCWSDYESDSSASRKFTFKIRRKQLEIEFKQSNGVLVAEYDEDQLYAGDKSGSKKPVLVTKYSQTGLLEGAVDSPTGLGRWYALAVIQNECNYYTEARQQFEATKKSVAYPTLSVSSNPSEQYRGGELSFTFDGYDAETMNFTVPEGAVSFDGETLTVKNAGEYKVVFTLKDESLYEWSGNTALSVKVEKKNIVITADEDNPAEWAKGEDVALNFRVTGLVSGESVKLEASYSKGGSGSAKLAVTDNGDGTHTVTIPKNYGTGEYVLTVVAAEGENYAERTAATHTFKITAEGLDLGDNEIRWRIDGKNYTIEDLKDGFLELEYTGKGLTLSVDISLSESAAELEIDGYGGDYATAIAVGEYTTTVHIVAADPNMYAFDETYTLKIKIVPKTLNLAEAEWEWQYAGESEWQPLNSGNMPRFDNRAVSVRISPDYFTSQGLAEGDYTVVYRHNDNLTEQGDKTTTAQVTVNNSNFIIENGTVTKEWRITAKALEYSWTGTQTVTAGDNTFEFPAIEFADGGDYSGFFEYYFTVDGVDGEFSKEELEEYIAEHWTETTPVTGTVHVRPKSEGQEVIIASSNSIFTTNTPKTALTVSITCGGTQYGAVNFSFEVKRGASDERARTTVTVSGGTLGEDVIFAGDSAEVNSFINGLSAGEYRIKVSVTAENSDAYVVTGDYDYRLTVEKRKVELPVLKGDVTYNGSIIYFKDCIEGFDSEIMTVLGAEYNGIDSGTEWRENGYYTTVRLNDPANYEFIVDGEGVAEYEYNWHIGKFIITEDMWDKSGAEGAFLNLPDWVNAMLNDPETLKLGYAYYNDTHGDALENVTFAQGSSYYVNAMLSGSAAGNFEFENGTSEDGVQTSAKTLYTVPKSSSIGEFFGSAVEYVKRNFWIVIIVAIVIELLIILLVVRHIRKRRSEYDDYYDDDDEYDEYEDYDDDDDYYDDDDY